LPRVRKIPPRLTAELWNDLIDDYPRKSLCQYVIYRENDTYYADATFKGGRDYSGTDASTVIQLAIDALTDGGTIFLKEIQLPTPVTYGDNILIIEEYQGERKIYSNKGKWRTPSLSTHPDTTGWGTAEKGRMWYNESINKLCFWDGSTIQTLPSAIGVGTYKLSPSYTIYTDGTTIYAMDEDGNIVFSGTDASTVIQSALDALTDGGLVFIKKGTYTINSRLTIKYSKTTIMGENETKLYCPFTGDKLYVEGNLTDVRLSSFTMDCASMSGNAIHAAGSQPAPLRRLTIDHMKILNA